MYDNTRDGSLAPSYGQLDKSSVKFMDDEMKIMMSGTLRALAKVPPAERSWETVLSTLVQNSLLEPLEQGKVDRVNWLTK